MARVHIVSRAPALTAFYPALKLNMLTLLIQTVFPQAGVALWGVQGLAQKLGHPKLLAVEWASRKDELQKLLPNIEKLLKQAGAGWGDMGKIVIVVGVGNFSATRISVTIANMLAFLTSAELYELKLTKETSLEDLIKLVQKKKNWKAVKLARPVYKTPPKISLSKKKSFVG